MSFLWLSVLNGNTIKQKCAQKKQPYPQPNQNMEWAALKASIRATKPGCTQAAQT